MPDPRPPLSALVRILVVAGLVAAFVQLDGVRPAGATTTAGYCADPEEAAILSQINAFRTPLVVLGTYGVQVRDATTPDLLAVVVGHGDPHNADAGRAHPCRPGA